MIQLDNTKGMELYSWSAEELRTGNEAVPYYIKSKIPAGIHVSTLLKNASLRKPSV